MNDERSDHPKRRSIVLVLLFSVAVLVLAVFSLLTLKTSYTEDEAIIPLQKLERMGGWAEIESFESKKTFVRLCRWISNSNFFYRYLPYKVNHFFQYNSYGHYEYNIASLILHKKELSKSEVEDLSGIFLAEVSKMTLINLKGTKIDKEITANLPMKKLVCLNLSETEISDELLGSLTGAKKLQSLDIGKCPAGINAGKMIGSCPQMEFLDLSETNFDDASLEEISALKSLRNLSLSGTKISDASADTIKDLKALRRLDLSKTKAGDKIAESVSKLPLLCDLSIAWTEIGEEGIAQFSAMPELSQLDARGLKLGKKSIAFFSGITNLRWLDLRESGISREDCSALQARHPELVIFCDK